MFKFLTYFTDPLTFMSRNRACFCQASLRGGRERCSAVFSPRLRSSLGGQQDQLCQPFSHTSIYPQPNAEHTCTHTDVNCSGPSPLGATRTLCFPLSLFSRCLHPLHLSFHPSLLLSLSFVPRNSCPAYCLIGILCTMGRHRGGPLSSV